MAYTKLIPRSSPGAKVEEISEGDHHNGYRLFIPSGKADKYRLAQLDDYTKASRSRFPLGLPPSASLRTSLSLSLSARASKNTIPGTWGFGLWNDPFGLSLGFGGNPFRLPALPNAVWFFGASEENYLSFRSEFLPERSEAKSKGGDSTGNLDTGEKRSRPTKPAVHGFLAQTFRSPKFHPLLIPAVLAFPFSRKTTRRLLGRVIAEDGTRLSVDVTQWHQYKIDWSKDQVAFEVDNGLVFESSVSPHSPLGVVIWIDNQFAAFTPEGRIGFGVLENPEPAWLEIKDLEINM
jgi:hypothetical protein